jgi:biotin carboxyl carrier protein
MKLQVEIGNDKHEIELHEDGGVVKAIIDGEEFAAEVSQPEPGLFLIKRGGNIFEAFVHPDTRIDGPKKVSINGRDHEIKLIDPRRLRGYGSNADHGEGLAEIRTAMPGRVVRVLVEADSEVEKGDGVLVVEAMKMQNELKSPKNGRVKYIRVAEGDTVAAGDVLATIE